MSAFIPPDYSVDATTRGHPHRPSPGAEPTTSIRLSTPKLACRLVNSPRRLVPTSPSTTDAQSLSFGAWSGGIGRWRVDVSAAAGHRTGASAGCRADGAASLHK